MVDNFEQVVERLIEEKDYVNYTVETTIIDDYGQMKIYLQVRVKGKKSR